MTIYEIAERDVGNGNLLDAACRAWPWSAVRVAVMGSDAFLESWRIALAETCASIASAELDQLDLVIAAETESKRALGLLDRCGSVAVVAAALDTTTCRNLARPRVVVLPPPLEDAGRRVAANWLVERARRFRERVANRGHVCLTETLQVDFDQRTLTSFGRTIPLRSGEAAVLRFLMERAGTWAPTAQICAEVFERSDDAAAKLAWKYISTLRKKLGPEADVLEMDRSRGYRLLLAS